MLYKHKLDYTTLLCFCQGQNENWFLFNVSKLSYHLIMISIPQIVL